jgi:hypothetical protein
MTMRRLFAAFATRITYPSCRASQTSAHDRRESLRQPVRAALESSAFLSAVTRLPLLAVLAALAALAAGCGGSKSPSVASLTTTAPSTGSPGTPAKPSQVAFAACLSQHGFAASVGSAGSAPNNDLSIFGVIVSGHVDPGSAQFQAAMTACRKYLPGGGPPALTPAQQAEWTKAMTRFAACVRANGIPGFPDPSGGSFAPGSLGSIDPSAPLAQKAFKACASLEPTVGPRIRF